MPCIFCLAVFAMLAGAVTAAVLDQLESQLATIATEPVRRPVSSASVTSYETSVRIPGTGRTAPVRVTMYRKHKRVRIQVLTHDLTREQAEAIEDLIAKTLGLTIVDRSDAHDEQKVREAFGEDAQAERDARPEEEPGAEEAETTASQPSGAEVDAAEDGGRRTVQWDRPG
jgi:septal ring factor EnvC (AmiA/AmiB activator)